MAGAVEDADPFTLPEAQHINGVVRFPPVQAKPVSGALFRWQIKTVHTILLLGPGPNRRADGSYLKNFLAFSKNPCAIGASLPSHIAENSWSFAFCALLR